MATYEARDPSGRQLATLELRRDDDTASFSQLHRADDRQPGDAAALVAALQAETKGLVGASLRVPADERDLLDALGPDRLLTTTMTRAIGADSGGAQYRDMTYDEFEEWRYTSAAEYLEELLPRYGGNQQVAKQKAEQSYDELLPKGFKTADTSLAVVLDDDGQRVAVLWLRHRYDDAPGGGSFVLDLEVDDDRRGQGWGRRALVAVDELTSAAGDDRVGLTVSNQNTIATRLYETSGFEPVDYLYDLRS